jgi:cation:H+ antiporter
VLVHVFFFVAGLALLVLGANALVDGAGKLALSFGLSPLVVGLTVVAFGTSAPELAVAVGAVINGQGDVAVGNVVGSNIFNILVILGLSAIIVPLVVHVQVIRQEMPIMLGSGALVVVFAMDSRLTLLEGFFLFTLLLAYTVFLVVQARKSNASQTGDFDQELQKAKPDSWKSKWYAQIGLVIVGLVMLVQGSDWLVDSAVVFAKALGISELIIGLTIVAAGTSLPEVAATLAAALKDERDMAVGNVLGSCAFNTMGVLGLAAIVANFNNGSTGLALAPSLVNFDLWVMLAAFFACLPVFLSGREIARWEGAVFVAYYVAYVAYLILQAQSHSALSAFSNAMLSFVIPITIVTLVVAGVRQKPH